MEDTTEFKEADWWGRTGDGYYKGRIEQIDSSMPFKLFKKEFYKEDRLCISNRHDPAWVLSLLTGYRQLGTFRIQPPHRFKERQDVVVRIENNKIIEVIPD